MIDPQIVAALDAVFDAFGPVKPAYSPGDVPHGYSWRQQWRAEPIGRCVRCLWPCHTPGPNGQPWHPLCWHNAAIPPPAFDQWMRRKVDAGEWGKR
jgi:hypothetical protein